MSERPSWMPKAPRIFLLAIFPAITFILYLILELGCINNTMSVVSPIIVRSNGSVPIGAQTTAPVDLRIGFWGLCFGPQPVQCTSSVSILQSKNATQLARSIPAAKGGGNLALARLALNLQANFAILSGIVLFVLVVLDLVANLVQIYFNLREEWEYQMQAAIWARSLDWAVVAGSVGAFSSYRALLVAVPDLLRATATQTGTMMMMMPSISAGTVAFNLFGAIVGIAVAGAVVNTLLTMSEVGAAVRTGGEVFKRPVARGGIDKAAIIRTQIVPGNGGDGVVWGGSKVDVLKPGYVPVYKRRPAYEAFP